MADIKTKPTDQSVSAFLEAIEDEKKRQDAFALRDLMQEVTGAEAKMWGDSIVGFGDMQYKNARGEVNDWFVVGFSPRKQNFALYLWGGHGSYPAQMDKLGKYKTGQSCIYVKRLSDVNQEALRELIREAVKHDDS
ncbi:MAG: DUF1801 domain-containing protein [Anaerolineae bacterium]|nr:DUF1801 domain-containing protein [Anaerolineae bacterium]